jgi:hypothetical protein
MAKQTPLFLHEEIMLLALRDAEGTIPAGACYTYAVAGAVLADLLMSHRIAIEATRWRRLVTLVSRTSLGEPFIDECLGRIAAAKRRASLGTWVSRIAGTANLKHRAAEHLCKRGILRADTGKILLVFTRRIYPEVNPEPERSLIERLNRAIFTDAQDVDPRTAALVSLANSADLLGLVFDRRELRRRKARIKQIAGGERVGQAIRDVISAANGAAAAAMMAACG